MSQPLFPATALPAFLSAWATKPNSADMILLPDVVGQASHQRRSPAICWGQAGLAEAYGPLILVDDFFSFFLSCSVVLGNATEGQEEDVVFARRADLLSEAPKAASDMLGQHLIT